MPSSVDYNDVQGLVRFGFGKMTEACYYLLNVKNAPAARAWLTTAPITTAVEMNPPPETALQIAFTRQGLEALGVTRKVIAGFSSEFISGMAGDASRSRRLADTAANSPIRFRWGCNPHATPTILIFLPRAA